jgi:hypothetical protein
MTQAQTLQVLLIEANAGDARLLQEIPNDSPSITVELTQLERMQDALTDLVTKVANIVLLDLGLPDAKE